MLPCLFLSFFQKEVIASELNVCREPQTCGHKWYEPSTRTTHMVWTINQDHRYIRVLLKLSFKMLKKLTSKTYYHNHLVFSCYSKNKFSVEMKDLFYWLLKFRIMPICLLDASSGLIAIGRWQGEAKMWKSNSEND